MSALDDAARDVAEIIKRQAIDVLGDASFAHMVWKAAKFYLPRMETGRPRTAADELPADKVAKWAARVVIFSPQDNGVLADSEPDAAINAEPRELLPTLLEVGKWARDAAWSYHADMGHAQPTGLDDAELERRLNGLRVTLSRAKGGPVWWRLQYYVGDEEWNVQVRLMKASPEAVERAQAPKLPMRREMPPEQDEASTARATAAQEAFLPPQG